MRAIGYGYAMALALAVSVTASGQAPPANAMSCYQRSGHDKQLSCLEALEARAQADLLAVERAMNLRLSASGVGGAAVERALQANERASASYREFRKRHCDDFAKTTSFGIDASDRVLLCHIELDAVHAKDLRALMHGV